MTWQTHDTRNDRPALNDHVHTNIHHLETSFTHRCPPAPSTKPTKPTKQPKTKHHFTTRSPSLNPPTIHSHRNPNPVYRSHHLHSGLPPLRPTPPLDQHLPHPQLMPRPPPPFPQSREAAKLEEFCPPISGLTRGRGKKIFGQIFSVGENNYRCSES